MTSLGMVALSRCWPPSRKPRSRAGSATATWQCERGSIAPATPPRQASGPPGPPAPRPATAVCCRACCSAFGGADAVQVPGVELAQVARRRGRRRGARRRGPSPSRARRGPRRASARRRASPSTLLEQPRVAERAAGEHDRGGAGALVGARGTASRSLRPPVRITGASSVCDEPRGEVVVGRALVVHGGAARVEADRADAGLVRRGGGRARSRRSPPGAGPSAA